MGRYKKTKESSTIQKAHKIRIYPTKEQEAYFYKASAAARKAYNFGLERWNELYDAYKAGNGEYPSAFAISREITKFKQLEENEWLYEVSAIILSRTASDLAEGWKAFFNAIKKGIHDVEKPSFKSHRSKRSFYLHNREFTHYVCSANCGAQPSTVHKVCKACGAPANRAVRADGRRLIVNKIPGGSLKLATPFRFENAKINSATISLDNGIWYIAISAELPRPTPAVPTNPSIGIDLGVKKPIVTSRGDTMIGPDLHRLQTQLCNLQQRFSKLSQYGRCAEGCCDTLQPMMVQHGKQMRRNVCANCKSSLRITKNAIKIKDRMERVRRDIDNIKNNYYHEVTTEISHDNAVICLETLNIKGMKKKAKPGAKHRGKINKGQRRKMQNIPLGEVVRQLEYKAEIAGTTVVKVDSHFPSSQLCSVCGYKQKMPRNIRTYVCPQCGNIIDRDLNAAINIEREGKRCILEADKQ